MELKSAYEPKEVEGKWYKFWEDNGYFRPYSDGKIGERESGYASQKGEGKPERESFSMVIPPPNISGALHYGHALDNTLQDIIIRWKRMQGYNTLWVPGTDHAGIVTQLTVEKQLKEKGIDRKQIGREEFIKRVWEWKEECGGQIINQLKKLGSSCDWSRLRFTMEPALYKAVMEEFVRLYEEGLIYRGNYIINWCPRCETALSDLEVEHKDINGNLYYINYPYEDGTGYVQVATTRPETMLGDTAVAVNPDDDRYKNVIGRTLVLPLMNRKIKIISDETVSTEFGTGAVKITPSHDPNDFEIGKKHNLDFVNILNTDGTLNSNAGKYAGLDRLTARKRVIEDLGKEGLLLKTETHLHAVGHCQRCATMVEPYVSTQWFVRTKDIAQEAIRVVEEGEIKIVPEMWQKTYLNWMYNIRDWCISRQIWWGHRIPVWYCGDCNEVIVRRETPDKCPNCGSGKLEQDPDVLDTWFSSALWPFSTMGWPEKTNDLKTFYPTSVIMPGFDIIFFWVARMIMMGTKMTGTVPFREVYIHALIRDEYGKKMSKSKGNVKDPLDAIDRYGTDALRFSLASFAVQGRDIPLSEERMEGCRHFANKIWNASRFVLMNLEGFKPEEISEDALEKSPEDLCVLSKYNIMVDEVNRYLESYEFDKASQSVYEFLWHSYCDWYIEFSKLRLNKQDGGRTSAQYFLTKILEGTLRVLHPFMPFITEEIWQKIPHKGETIMLADYPCANPNEIDLEAVNGVEKIMEIIRTVRAFRKDFNINPKTEIKAHINVHNEETAELVNAFSGHFRFMVKITDCIVDVGLERPENSAVLVIPDVEIYIPLLELINVDAEIERLKKELAKIDAEMEKSLKKLDNQDFLDNAPQEIVEKERAKLEESGKLKDKIEANIGMIKGE